MSDVRLIVAASYEIAFKTRRSLRLDPRRVKLISTSDQGSANLSRGMMLNKDQVVWVPGWTEGKHARVVEEALRICMMKGSDDADG